jgi:hypothetical protein
MQRDLAIRIDIGGKSVKCEAFNLALVHIYRKMRDQVVARIEQLKDMASPINVLVPEPGERIKS